MLLWIALLLWGDGTSDPPPTPTVSGDFGRRRMASFIKRGGVGTLRGRTT
jgi:hypothetical protein